MDSEYSGAAEARDRLRKKAQNEATCIVLNDMLKDAQGEIVRLREENERLRNNVLVLGDNQQPVAEYDGVEFSRYTLRWINGVMPVGTKLYAPPVFDVQAEKNRHDAEELEALHMNLRDNNVPTHDENGEPFSAWGRVLWFAEKRNVMPVRYVSLQHIKTKVTDANPNPVQVNVISERNGAWLDMPREKIDSYIKGSQDNFDALVASGRIKK